MVTMLSTALLMFSCGPKGEEETKMISSDRVNLVGTHSELLDVSDSIKVMLVKTDAGGKEWTIKAIVPVENARYWKNVPGTNEKEKEYYVAKMGNASSKFLDVNDSEVLEGNMQWDKLESILAANEYKEVKLELQAHKSLFSEYRADYKTAKAAFDKIEGMELSKLDLSKVYKAEDTSSSSYDDIEDALEQYEKALDAAATAVSSSSLKNAKKAMNEYEKALNELEDMDW